MIRSREKFTLRKKIYLFFFVAGLIYFLMPHTVNADTLGYSVQDVYQEITDEVSETNNILQKAFKASTVSPFTIFNGSKMGSNIYTASKSVALVVGTLLLMMDFFKKTITFEWSSRWENILLFLIKVIAVKQIIQNADVIVTHVYALFDYVNKSAVGTEPEFLPCGNYQEIVVKDASDIISSISMPYSIFRKIRNLVIPGAKSELKYNISADAVHIFYPSANVSEHSFKFGELLLETPKNIFNSTLERILLVPYFFLMKLLAYAVFVVVIGRMFELCVYTLLAPLPLCTYAAEGTQDIAKNFLKNYIACILQMTVIAAMFTVYAALMSSKYFMDSFGKVKLIHLLLLATLSLGVMRSGEWARRLCGA